MKVFVFDYARCNGCRNCQIVCKDEHCDNNWPGYAKPQPESGQFWTRVTERVRGTVPKVVISYDLNMCRHCDDAPCAKACGDDAFKRREDGLLVLDPDACTGCLACVDACPYKVIFANQDLSIAQKCTGCAHLLDDGWDEPRCVDACPSGSLKFLDEAKAKELYPAESQEASQNKERLIIVNKPKTFAAGTVIDIVADEVLIGAKVTLENIEDGSLLEQTTDDFGDFWFKQIDAGDYRIYFEMDGYLTQSLELSTKEADCNLGSISLSSTAFFDIAEDQLEIAEEVRAAATVQAEQADINDDGGNEYYVFKNT